MNDLQKFCLKNPRNELSIKLFTNVQYVSLSYTGTQTSLLLRFCSAFLYCMSVCGCFENSLGNLR